MLVTLVALAVVAPVAGQDVKPDPRETLETAIPEGIRLLEEKEFLAFVKSFVSPEDLKKITERTPLEEFAEGFAKRKAPRLLEVLKEIQDKKPKLDDAGTTATFTFEKLIGGKNSITFTRIEKRWYVQN